MFGDTVTITLGSNAFPTGAIGPYLATVNGIQEPNAITLYEKAAWLVNQFGTVPTADNGGLQNAIWDLFLQRAGTGLNTDKTTDAYWLLEAAAKYTALTSAQMANTYFLTPVSGTTTPSADGTPQEFIVVLTTATPEPSTYAMLGAGVILLPMGRLRRRRNKVS